MGIKTGREKYIRNANTLEDTAKRLHCEVKYTVGHGCISLVISHKSKPGKILILCTNDIMVGEDKYKRIGLNIRYIVNDEDMMRLALNELKNYATNVVV